MCSSASLSVRMPARVWGWDCLLECLWWDGAYRGPAWQVACDGVYLSNSPCANWVGFCRVEALALLVGRQCAPQSATGQGFVMAVSKLIIRSTASYTIA
eukprot:330475-Chlamydomonas_euryale.AAC.2